MEKTKNIWEEIVKKLIEKKYTISTMESCTGGGIANQITNIQGASTVLQESYVTYSNEAKIKQGVSFDVIEKYTVYSRETASEMAKAVKRISKSRIAIGVTGQLGRIDPNNPYDKLNHVWFTIIAGENKLIEKEVIVPDEDRKKQKDFVIEKIAETLLEYLYFID